MEQALQTLRASMLECRECAALVKCRSRVVPGDGEIPAEVMFVGIAPGRFGGDLTGVPFSGDRSGILLRRMLARAHIDDVFITNLVRCNPRDERGRNRDPLAGEIGNCRRHLEAEIAIVKPRVIACLGAMAWRHIGGVNSNAPFDPVHPSIQRRADAIIYPMYHPGYVIRGAYAERRYIRDFLRLRRYLDASHNVDLNQLSRDARSQWKSPRNQFAPG
jgi:uracil-DNA glycosylase family 4